MGTGFGAGYIPVAPGTVGSLWGVLLVWMLDRAGLPIWGHILVAGTLFGVGIPLCSRAAQFFTERDPGAIVFDEIAPFPLVFLPLVLLSVPFDVATCVTGFLWFRLFDIVKPWPIPRLEKLPDGLGIMADDLAAALYAAAALALSLAVWSWGK